MSDLTVQAENAATKPSAPQFKPRACMECGAEFVPARFQQEFCCRAHAKTWNNRRLAEGAAIITLAKAWRAARNARGNTPEAIKARETGSKALSEMVSIIDGFMADDRAEGRPNPLPYAGRLLANGKRYMDRSRRS